MGWSQKELAERAGVALNTVRLREGRRTPAAYIITAMRAAIGAAGIMLLFDEDGGAAAIARRSGFGKLASITIEAFAIGGSGPGW